MKREIALELNEALRLNDTQSVAEVFPTPADFINSVLPNIILLAAFLLFIFIFIGGFKIVLNPDSKKASDEGKKSLTYAIVGFVILLGAYWIIQIVQVLTGVTIL